MPASATTPMSHSRSQDNSDVTLAWLAARAATNDAQVTGVTNAGAGPGPPRTGRLPDGSRHMGMRMDACGARF